MSRRMNSSMPSPCREAAGKTRVLAVDWGVWAQVGMAAEAAGGGDEAPDPVPEPVAQPMLDTGWHDAQGRRVFETALSATSHWIIDEHRTAARDAILPGTGYLELAAEALAAQGERGPFEIRNLQFLRPLGVEDGTTRAARTRLRPSDQGYDFEVLGACDVAGRTGHLLTAKASLITGIAEASDARVDLQALTRRTRAKEGAALASPQEAHLAFGARWAVLRSMRFGAREGLAHLALPVAARGDLRDGYLLHPALMDLATGWALDLAPGYDNASLWVPAGYRRAKVLRPLPAEVFSWVRLATDSEDDRFAEFDVSVCDKDGAVLVDIEGFTMTRLAADATFARRGEVDAGEVEFDAASDTSRQPSAAEERLAYLVSQGIRPDEGPEALLRALATGQSQVVVSSMELLALIRQAEAVPAEAGPAHVFDRPDGDADFVAPATAIEKTLAGFWQDLLGVSKVGVTDSFFDLGGHSLIAVRLFSKVRKAYGAEFTISALFEAPTIAALAALIAERTGAVDEGDAPVPVAPMKRRFEHLVAMHEGTGGDGTPMFMVAGMFGNVLNLRHLAQAIGTDRPFYGLQARGLLGDTPPHGSISAAARDYIAEMRQVQPEGPYLLGGFSGGGITAYEMARQLAAAGQDVAMLVMLDTPLPVRPTLTSADKTLIKLSEMRRKGPAYLAEWLRNRWRWELEKRRSGDVVQAASDLFRDGAIEAAFRAAVSAYDLQLWDGPVTLFRPPLDRHWRVSRGRWVSRAREYVLADNDWGGWLSRLVVQEVPGDHDSMVLEPNVRVLAQRLRACLDAADCRTNDVEAPEWIPATAAE